MEFTENMVGKIVREFDTGDEGVVRSKHDNSVYYEGGDRVMVEWYTGKEAGKHFHINLNDVEFIDNFTKEPKYDIIEEPKYDIIEVAGVKYKLVPV